VNMENNYTSQELKEHYKELYETALSELKFEKLCVKHLYSVLDEILTISDDELAKAVIENGTNRHRLDKLIHAKGLFKDETNTKKT